MEYIVKVHVGNMVYKTLKLTLTEKAIAALTKNSEVVIKAIKRKITELVDTYSWTHLELIGHGERAVVRH
jgi:hypothetical protein